MAGVKREPTVSSVTRGHKYKLYKQNCSKSVRSQFFCKSCNKCLE